MLRIKFLILLILGICSACSEPKSLSKNELIRYLNNEKNGLHLSKNVGELSIQIQYQPSDLIAYPDLVSSINPDSISAYYNKYVYFKVSFSYDGHDFNNAAVVQNQPDLLSYLVSGISADVKLFAGRKELDLIDFMHVNTFSSTPSSDVLLVFENKVKNADKLVLKLDQGPMNIGGFPFVFHANDINSIPKLKFSIS